MLLRWSEPRGEPLKVFEYKSLIELHPEWTTETSICSRNSLGRVDALSIFDNSSQMFSVVYSKDFGAILPNASPDSLIRERLEWSRDILELAEVTQCARFRTDYSWRMSNAKFLIPVEGRGLVAWIQEESSRARELRGWMESSRVKNVRDLLTLET